MNVRLWDLNTETPSHVLSGHVGWVLCLEWEAMERKLASGGHDGRVRAFRFILLLFSMLIQIRSGSGTQPLAKPWETR